MHLQRSNKNILLFSLRHSSFILLNLKDFQTHLVDKIIISIMKKCSEGAFYSIIRKNHKVKINRQAA